MTSAPNETFTVGPLRIGSADVVITTNSSDFALAAGWAFSDLATPVGAPSAGLTVAFNTVEHTDASVRWSVHRDGEPCELELQPDAVLGHQQWELNRLAIESEPTSIHAAAVAIDGRAALLIGSSRSGKTTLAGWLAAHHGIDYLSDEVASIDTDGRVAPFSRPLGVRPDSPLASTPLDRLITTSVDAEAAARFMPDERLLPVTALGGRLRPSSTPVTLLVFPTFDAERTLSSRPLDAADTFEQIAQLTPGLAGFGRPVFDRLCALVESAEAIAVRYPDVRQAAPVVTAALERSVPR